MKTIEQIFGKSKIVPTVTIEDPQLALPVAEILLNAGINVIAIRALSKNSLLSINKLAKDMPSMTVGAAGVMDAAGFLNASLAGAEFISSPGITSELITAARTRYNDAHFLPGVCLPSHVMELLSNGFQVMNLFPAEIMNGYELIKSYHYTFPKAKFAVTGGITPENMTKYLQLPNLVAVGLSSIASSILVKNQDFDEIKRRAVASLAIANNLIL